MRFLVQIFVVNFESLIFHHFSAIMATFLWGARCCYPTPKAILELSYASIAPAKELPNVHSKPTQKGCVPLKGFSRKIYHLHSAMANVNGFGMGPEWAQNGCGMGTPLDGRGDKT